MEEILEDVFPMSPQEIRQNKKHEKLLKHLQEHKDYDTKRIEGKDLIMYKKQIYIPNSLKDRVMEWYHTYLVHPGSTRMLSTIQRIMHWHGMRKDIEEYVQKCDVCQRCKKQRKSMVCYHLRLQRQHHGSV